MLQLVVDIVSLVIVFSVGFLVGRRLSNQLVAELQETMRRAGTITQGEVDRLNRIRPGLGDGAQRAAGRLSSEVTDAVAKASRP